MSRITDILGGWIAHLEKRPFGTDELSEDLLDAYQVQSLCRIADALEDFRPADMHIRLAAIETLAGEALKHSARIADALETLVQRGANPFEGATIVYPPEFPIGQRCDICSGTGIKNCGVAGEYCTCPTGRDLQRMHKDAPGASV